MGQPNKSCECVKIMRLDCGGVQLTSREAEVLAHHCERTDSEGVVMEITPMNSGIELTMT